jgi:hypothetical protein
MLDDRSLSFVSVVLIAGDGDRHGPSDAHHNHKHHSEDLLHLNPPLDGRTIPC